MTKTFSSLIQINSPVTRNSVLTSDVFSLFNSF